MSSRDAFELPRARIEVEARPGYLFVVESGQLSRLSELRRYTQWLDAVATRHRRDRALIDARGEVGEPPPEVREAMWHWLTREERVLRRCAFVLASEMAVARVNMTALSKGAGLRAFDAVQSAQRWLLRDRSSSLAETEPRVESSPPQGEPVVRTGRRERVSPGSYRSSEAPADHVKTKRNGGSRVA